MGDRISLRSLLIAVAVAALFFIFVRMAIVNQQGGLLNALLFACIIPVVTFVLYGLFYFALLPFGVLTKVATESAKGSESPFATDRLPENQLPAPDHPTNSHH